MVFWGRSVLGRQKFLRKVPQRFHQGWRLRKFRDLSGLLGQICWGAKRFCRRFPHHFFKFVPQFLNYFLHFSPTASALGSSAIVKCLGAKSHVCLLGFFAANGFRLPKGSLECSPNRSLHWSHSLLRFFGQMAVAWEGSVEGSANCALHVSPSLLLGSKLLEVLTCLTHTNPVGRKRPIMSLLLGYSLGLFPPKMLGLQCSNLFWVLLTAWFFRVARRGFGRTWWHRDFWIRKVGGVCLCGLCSPQLSENQALRWRRLRKPYGTLHCRWLVWKAWIMTSP